MLINSLPQAALIDQFSYLTEYQTTYLTDKAPGTVDVYLRLIKQFISWLVTRVGNDPFFQPEQFTKTALQSYLIHLEKEGYSQAHCHLVKSATSSFATFLIEDKALLGRNPTRGVAVGVQPLLAPRELSADQRYILRNVVERTQDLRSQALFALGYWAGCRVSDVSWLLLENSHLSAKSGWLTVGHKGGKRRELRVEQ